MPANGPTRIADKQKLAGDTGNTVRNQDLFCLVLWKI